MDELQSTKFKRAIRVSVVVLFILLAFASGAALVVAGRYLNFPLVAGLSAIPFAIALFTLASLVKAGPWFLETLKLVFPQLGPAIDGLQRYQNELLRRQSLLKRLKSYLEENDLHHWSCDILKTCHKLTLGADATPGGENELALLDEMLAIIKEAIVTKYRRPLVNSGTQEDFSTRTPTGKFNNHSLDNHIDQLIQFKRGLSPECSIPASQEDTAEITERVLQAISLIGLAVFINEFAYEQLKWGGEICQRAARIPETPLVMLAYLELKENREKTRESDGKDFVTLCELIEQWVNVLIHRYTVQEGFQANTGGGTWGGFCHEITTLRQAFQDRIWISHLWQLLQRVHMRLQRNLQPIYHLQQVYPSILQSLKRIFGNLDLTTIERFLQARTVNAYLLTFNSAQGKLATLIDSLIDTQQRADIAALGLNLSDQEYQFKRYMPSSRIGVIPKGWSFQRFHDAFEADLNLLIKNLTKLPFYRGLPLQDIEIILQQFGLCDHFTYPPNGSPFSSLQSRKATQSIHELLAGVLDNNDFLAMIAYEHKSARIIDLLMDSSIAELVSTNGALTPAELAQVAEADSSLKLTLLQSLNRLPPTVQSGGELTERWVRCSVRQLDGILENKPDLKEQIVNALVMALSEVQTDDPQIDEVVRWAMRKLGRELVNNPTLKRQTIEALSDALVKLLPVLAASNGSAPDNTHAPMPYGTSKQHRVIAERYVNTLEAIGAIYPEEDANKGS